MPGIEIGTTKGHVSYGISFHPVQTDYQPFEYIQDTTTAINIFVLRDRLKD